jgi:hypothetical protein
MALILQPADPRDRMPGSGAFGMKTGGFLFSVHRPIRCSASIEYGVTTMDARPNNSQPEPGRPVLSEDEVRQGVTGHHVRQVLIVSTGSAMLLLLLVYLIYFWR